jgi:uncharacterized protein YjbJ (UPF0337 family)
MPRSESDSQVARGKRIFDVKESTKNRAKGRLKEASGKAKSKVGRATSNRRLQDRGDSETVAGKIQRKVGEIGKVFGG